MITILGAGSWAAALAIVLQRNGHGVRIWSPFEEEAEHLRSTRRLPHKLPGVVLPDDIEVTSSLSVAAEGSVMVVLAVPSEYFRSTVNRLASNLDHELPLVSCTKGIEPDSCCTMSQILRQVLPSNSHVVALSGPSHAEEVSCGIPTAIVAASPHEAAAAQVQESFQQPTFRVYTNPDILGVELGGALKNIIAIATGVADGLGYGDNARAALITRGLAEIARLGSAVEASPQTFSGLSGLGDLVVTCTSRHSRNRKLGELLAQGYDLESAQEELGMVAEGVNTARAVANLQQRYSLEMPISSQVAAMLFRGLEPEQAVNNLLSRSTKAE